jgi:hypothetical protein
MGLALLGRTLKVIEALPDDVLVTDPECEAITRLDRVSLWRIEHGLDGHGNERFDPEPLLKSYKLGPKRKVRLLGNVRLYVRKRLGAVPSTP